MEINALCYFLPYFFTSGLGLLIYLNIKKYMFKLVNKTGLNTYMIFALFNI